MTQLSNRSNDSIGQRFYNMEDTFLQHLKTKNNIMFIIIILGLENLSLKQKIVNYKNDSKKVLMLYQNKLKSIKTYFFYKQSTTLSNKIQNGVIWVNQTFTHY